MATHWQMGDRMQHRWEIYKILRGGMGIVYIVYDHESGMPFAAKTFRDEIFTLDPQIADRFTLEARAWINLDVHQNVTQALFVQQIAGKPLLFLEYVSGGDLRGWIGTPRLTQDLPQVLRFAIQFCDGMSHALAKGIRAHRDIKPENCLITEDNTLKVTDFGLAKVFDDTRAVAWAAGAAAPSSHAPISSLGLTRAGTAAGTCTHMAPEQFEDARQVDVRADLYAFGVLLFEMVTGRLPFVVSAHTVQEAWEGYRQAHQKQQPPSVGSGHTALDAVVARCLTKEPGQRGASFAEVREPLSELYRRLTGEPAPQAVSGRELDAGEWSNKGASLEHLGRPKEAMACYERALELNPRDEHAWLNKGAALQALSQTVEALTCYEHALGLNPRFADAWTNEGMALGEGFGQWQEAMACYERALELNPRDEKAWSNKGMALGEGFGQWQEAVTCYERALELDPRNEKTWFNKGVALNAVGQIDAAMVCYDHALRLNPRLEQAWINKGVALNDVGQIVEAIACYDHALELNPRLAEVWFNKGLALQAMGQIAEAIACYERALELNPRLAEVWGSKGVALGTSGRHREALACFEEAYRLGHPQAAQVIAQLRQMLGQR